MKKEREFLHLERFKKFFPEFPLGDVKSFESPDFLISTPERIIGIELTELFRPNTRDNLPLQAQESLWKRVVDKACQIYEKNHEQSLIISILFNEGRPFNKTEIDRLANEIVTLLDVIDIGTEKQYFTLKRTRENNQYFPKEVGLINVGVLPTQKNNFWRPSHAGWVLEADGGFFQRQINRKNEKVEIYKENCDAVWLLMVVENLHASSFIELSLEAQKSHYITDFDRVFLLSYSDRKYIELE